jgi:hypothetical protein
MKRFVSSFLALALLGTAAGRAQAGPVVVTFDDLSGSGVVPDGYGGIKWMGHWDYYGDPQDPYTPHSAPNRIYTDYNQPVAFGHLGVGENTFAFLTPETFLGAWVSGAGADGIDVQVGFNLYYQGNLVHSTPLMVPTDVPAFLASGYNGLVDTVGVYSTNHDYFVLDDITYSTAKAPEPASLTLCALGAGLTGLAWRRRKDGLPPG